MRCNALRRQNILEIYLGNNTHWIIMEKQIIAKRKNNGNISLTKSKMDIFFICILFH